MEPPKLDKTSMLLSADWFGPFWILIGLSPEDQRKVVLQLGCRDIVKQIMSGAEQYWLADFSRERVAATLLMFQELAEKAQLERLTRDRLAVLIGEKKEPIEVTENTKWLLVSITEEALAGSVTDPPLPSHLRQPLSEVQTKWTAYVFDSGQFEQACKNSASAWDQYLSKCTPDLPCMLSDYAASLMSQGKFNELWHIVTARLSQQQRDEVFHWYRAVAHSDGIELVLPS